MNPSTSTPLPELLVLTIGLAGQAMFSARFLIQWIASERLRRSTIPVLFWHFSLAGGFALFVYAAIRRDPVFMLGQGFGMLVYLRNLWLIRRHDRETTAPPADATS